MGLKLPISNHGEVRTGFILAVRERKRQSCREETQTPIRRINKVEEEEEKEEEGSGIIGGTNDKEIRSEELRQAIIMSTNTESSSSLPSQRLLGKVALITGGATGIGESIVRLFHKHGAKVCIVDLQDDLGGEVCKSLLSGEPKETVCFIHGDVRVEDDISNAVDFAVKQFGTLDILINNAGLTGAPCPDIRNYSLGEFEMVFDVNVKGAFLGMKHAARVMIPEKKGSIVSLCSVGGVVGGVGPHAYVGSKHAVLGLTRSVAAELGQHGIRVNCVSPYAVATKLAMAHLPEAERTDDTSAGFRTFAAANANLKGVELTVDDVASAVLFLASDESRYISGDNLMIDGGFTCTNHSFRVFRIRVDTRVRRIQAFPIGSL